MINRYHYSGLVVTVLDLTVEYFVDEYESKCLYGLVL